MSTPTPTIWCDGAWQAAAAPVVAALDRGLAVGLGLFESLLCLDGVPLAWTRHLDRLEASALQLGIAPPPSAALGSVVPELLERNGLTRGRARLRITLTSGAGALDVVEPASRGVVLLGGCAAADPAASVAVAMGPWTRNERDPLAGHKCTSYAANVLALSWARRQGCDEVLFANNRGDLCEGATSNVFIELGGTLFTPSLITGCLPGVTRALVLDLARGAGIPVEEGDFASGRIAEAGEAFLTSATRGVQPVHKLGAKSLPAPGLRTQRLAAALADLFARNPDP